MEKSQTNTLYFSVIFRTFSGFVHFAFINDQYAALDVILTGVLGGFFSTGFSKKLFVKTQGL